RAAWAGAQLDLGDCELLAGAGRFELGAARNGVLDAYDGDVGEPVSLFDVDGLAGACRCVRGGEGVLDLVPNGEDGGPRDHGSDDAEDADHQTSGRQAAPGLRPLRTIDLTSRPGAEDDGEKRPEPAEPDDGEDERGNGQAVRGRASRDDWRRRRPGWGCR